MPPRKAQPPSDPPFFEAVADLMQGSPDSGVMPVAAFRAGDRVPLSSAELEAHGWRGLVRVPDAYAQPETEPEPEGKPKATAPETMPETVADAKPRSSKTSAATAAGKDGE